MTWASVDNDANHNKELVIEIYIIPNLKRHFKESRKIKNVIVREFDRRARRVSTSPAHNAAAARPLQYSQLYQPCGRDKHATANTDSREGVRDGLDLKESRRQLTTQRKIDAGKSSRVYKKLFNHSFQTIQNVDRAAACHTNPCVRTDNDVNTGICGSRGIGMWLLCVV